MTANVRACYIGWSYLGHVDRIIDEQGATIALVTAGTAWAARIAQLLDRHGLADIPDTPADLTEGR